ncbi:peroxiredoxin-like family protein [Streptomyces hoynatensis]|uniref:AhpC/TSA family protein n=1 Tax=Streptomyces hoynatensis TaxID=1141874 RepID=A0A3A9YD76_9ACTN|nr:peroxiredoxin-like family protein [Streptomyces hoynatensis]RKN35160.1 AhpC/TSA family protein [Streptomyces hoynatensis]
MSDTTGAPRGARAPRGGRRLRAGDVVPARELAVVPGNGQAPTVGVPARDGMLTHLQFRRFAGCPICNLHLHSLALRHEEIAAAGVREVVVFHSPAAELSAHVPGLPFAVVADPEKRLYAEFGVESAPRALLNPRAWTAILRGVTRELGPVLLRRRKAPSLRPQGGRLGLPADFLIAPDGRVLAVAYGAHAGDQWSADELLALAAPPPAAP